MRKDKQKKPSSMNAGRLIGIAAGSYVVGVASIVLRPIVWLAGVLFGLCQVLALCLAVALGVYWLVGRFTR